MKKTYTLILVTLLFAATAQAQDAVFPGLEEKEDPAEKVYRGGAFLLAASFLLDNSIRKEVASINNKTFDDIMVIDRYYGQREITAAGLLGIYGISALADNQRWKDASETAILSALVSTVINVAIKDAVGRARPHAGKGAHHYTPFRFKESRRAFMSGHATVTMAVSASFADVYDAGAWKALCYGAALLTGTARIYRDQHWASDVIGGWLWGYFVAQKSREFIKSKKATPTPGVTFKDGTALLTLSINF